MRPKTQQPRQDSCRGCGIYLGVDLLSHANIRSIMGDEALNFRVRNGFGCTRLSLDTKEISKYIIDRDEEVPFENKTHGLLVSVSSTPHSAYTPDLSTSWSRTTLEGGFTSGKTHLQASFPLRCFQRLSLPHLATRQCHWRDNRYTRGASTPVLSY